MTYTSVYSTKAETELLKAYYYYEKEVPGLGDRFANCIEHKIEGIKRDPNAYPIRRGSLHECWVKDFHFLIVYQILEDDGLILSCQFFTPAEIPERSIANKNQFNL